MKYTDIGLILFTTRNPCHSPPKKERGYHDQCVGGLGKANVVTSQHPSSVESSGGGEGKE